MNILNKQHNSKDCLQPPDHLMHWWFFVSLAGGNMRFLFAVLLLLTCMPVHAATMCVPDLSTCESCTDFDTIGELFWSANCCGVPVSGIWLAQGNNKRSIDINTLAQQNPNFGTGGMGYNTCIMLSPFIAPYAVNVECSVLAYSYICDKFIPRCAMTSCNETIKCDYSGYE